MLFHFSLTINHHKFPIVSGDCNMIYFFYYNLSQNILKFYLYLYLFLFIQYLYLY